jgi:hypothetical protein
LEDGKLGELWRQKAAQGAYAETLMETMYPGYCLGDGAALQWAMEQRKRFLDG